MSILTGPQIVATVVRTENAIHCRKSYNHDNPADLEFPAIRIDPFESERVGPNSYDLTLSDKLLIYDSVAILDARSENLTLPITIPENGLILKPGVLYLGSTVEKTATSGLVPWIEGRSSIGRLGISVHATAGFGDDGWGWPDGATWTLEISVIERVRIYPGMRVCQIAFTTLLGDRKPYAGKYQKQIEPTASRMWQENQG